MATTDTNKCDLPSVNYYTNFDSVSKKDNYSSVCDSDEKLHPGEDQLSIENLLNTSDVVKKQCTYLQHWLHDNVINIPKIKSPIFYIILFYAIWEKIIEKSEINNNENCATKYSSISVNYHTKWKKMYDYNDDYKELKCAFQKKVDCKESGVENCKEICKLDCQEVCKEYCKDKYCKYFADIFNIYNELEQICRNGSENTYPEFWETFKTNYLSTSDIEELCQNVYEEHGFYKVKVSLGKEGEEKYVYQYESTYMFSFFEKLIGYSIKKVLSKALYYSKYIVLPILLILIFYFFMKKLSLFGCKIAPKADDMRKMWRNVQGVTNPGSLLNPMKPPLGGNKMGLPYIPK
ncbi:PIR Superfamily Protein [Plasmodium ovale curtisi]|uniref:PIR Superfamily Protein n=1 Tax=Plasmodium ovale curtisi TaxID=864141 RepID=A0A1A8WT57_PLAOA|nr:PIR Superfamily Protein [Plasmodium ovale curtisi]SBS99755.1 PIR Superfamily Protein [Plasmodium ovale curtisi]